MLYGARDPVVKFALLVLVLAGVVVLFLVLRGPRHRLRSFGTLVFFVPNAFRKLDGVRLEPFRESLQQGGVERRNLSCNTPETTISQHEQSSFRCRGDCRRSWRT